MRPLVALATLVSLAGIPSGLLGQTASGACRLHLPSRRVIRREDGNGMDPLGVRKTHRGRRRSTPDGAAGMPRSRLLKKGPLRGCLESRRKGFLSLWERGHGEGFDLIAAGVNALTPALSRIERAPFRKARLA